MKFVFGLIIAVGFAFISCSAAYAQAPREQLRLMVEQLQGSPGDNALRGRIINATKAMNPPPAMPEETVRRMARGIAAFKDAKSVSDYKDAVAEFEKAALAAPWYADAYYNLAQAQAKAEDYAGASSSLKLYLLAAPGAKDAANAKSLMYEMEYKQEKADRERSAARPQEQTQAQPASRFIDQGGGVLKDTKTGLEWMQSDHGLFINWAEAQHFCANQTGGWRLPSVDELLAIYDANEAKGTKCDRGTIKYVCKVSPLFHLSSDQFWSDTANGSSYFWVAVLTDGKRFSSHMSNPSSSPLCTRG